MLVWVVVLGVLVVGLAGWIVYDLFFSATTAPNGEIARVLSDYQTAWETEDAAMFAALTSDDYEFISGDQSVGPETMELRLSMMNGFRVERIGQEVWAGDGPTYHVSRAQTIYTDSGFPGPDGVDGISTISFVEDGDSYLVVMHRWFGPSG